MKNLKLLAALLALTIGLAGCGGSSKGGSRPASSASKNKLDGDNMTAPSTQEQEYEEPEDVAGTAVAVCCGHPGRPLGHSAGRRAGAVLHLCRAQGGYAFCL